MTAPSRKEFEESFAEGLKRVAEVLGADEAAEVERCFRDGCRYDRPIHPEHRARLLALLQGDRHAR